MPDVVDDDVDAFSPGQGEDLVGPVLRVVVESGGGAEGGGAEGAFVVGAGGGVDGGCGGGEGELDAGDGDGGGTGVPEDGFFGGEFAD